MLYFPRDRRQALSQFFDTLAGNLTKVIVWVSPCTRQPLALRGEVPGQNSKKGDGGEDDWRVVESISSHRENQRREEHTSKECVPDQRNAAHSPRPAAE
jgi:hypothetical protein